MKLKIKLIYFVLVLVIIVFFVVMIDSMCLFLGFLFFLWVVYFMKIKIAFHYWIVPILSMHPCTQFLSMGTNQVSHGLHVEMGICTKLKHTNCQNQWYFEMLCPSLFLWKNLDEESQCRAVIIRWCYLLIQNLFVSGLYTIDIKHISILICQIFFSTSNKRAFLYIVCVNLKHIPSITFIFKL